MPYSADSMKTTRCSHFAALGSCLAASFSTLWKPASAAPGSSPRAGRGLEIVTSPDGRTRTYFDGQGKGESGHYVTLPFHRKRTYDIVFVDGRLRADCLAVARRVVSPGGVVLLHDAHRKNYRHAVSLFSRRETASGTAILRP